MISLPQRREPQFGWMLCLSLLIHLASFIILVKFQFYTLTPAEGPVYYVDVVTLPVANPRAGAPSPPGGAAASSSTGKEEMTVPTTPAKKAFAKTKTADAKKSVQPAETDRDFKKRLAQIEKKVGESDLENTIANLQKKTAGRGQGAQTGIPGGKGTEAGSDYAGYIRARLTDAFRTTIAYQTKKPEVMVRLTIDRFGKVAGVKLERSSKDRMFEDAVVKAIAKAEQSFVPPPAGGRFEYSFRFAPEGVSKK